jgi:hypothetical protein
MTFTVRRLMGRGFVIDNGAELLAACPCCGKEFMTKHAAEATVEALKAGAYEWSQAAQMAEAAADLLPFLPTSKP